MRESKVAKVKVHRCNGEDAKAKERNYYRSFVWHKNVTPTSFKVNLIWIRKIFKNSPQPKKYYNFSRKCWVSYIPFRNEIDDCVTIIVFRVYQMHNIKHNIKHIFDIQLLKSTIIQLYSILNQNKIFYQTLNPVNTYCKKTSNSAT